MELIDAMARRRMVRAFDPTALAPSDVDLLLDRARRAPSAGNSQAVSFVVLEGAATNRYWDTTLPQERRQTFRWQKLLLAPVLVLVCTDPSMYRDRYAEPDKSKTGLGQSLTSWPVPYWWVDAGAVVQNILLLATAAELGACLFGPFDHEAAVKDEFNLNDPTRIVATIAIGHPAADTAGRSSQRPRPPLDSVVLRP